MDEGKRNMEGSVSRDRFRQKRKEELPTGHYALDIDLMLISKNEYNGEVHPMFIAVLDFKNGKRDGVTFSEALTYNQFKEMGIPVYLICAINDITELDVDKHRFRIIEYEHGEWEPNWKTDNVPTETSHIADPVGWDGLYQWEAKLRERREQEYIGRLQKVEDVSTLDVDGSSLTDYSLLKTLKEEVKNKPSLVNELVGT